MTVSTCFRCGAAVHVPDDRFCEACGSALPGTTLPGDRTRDATADGNGAAASDVGRLHHRNEDAFYVGVHSRRLMAVVCDGVSSSFAPDVAARVAADAAGDRLHEGGTGTDDEGAMHAAVAAARRAVAAVPWAPDADHGAPACTFVGAVYDGDRVVVASIGDSRAYWIGEDSAAVLTRDDSWVEEQLAAGILDETTLAADPRAHMITNWLGVDAPDGDTRVTTFEPGGAGRVVLCSDGLWNYAPEPEQVAALVATVGPDASAATVADALVDVAVASGGRDNVTVAVLDIGRDRAPSGGIPT